MFDVLAGLRVVEGSAFVAAPLAGMTLAQMGADVIRFDRVRGGLDYTRWPVTADGRSLFWEGLNKGKRSIAVDMTTPEGKEIVTQLVTAPGEDAGVFLTNLRVRGFMDYATLSARRQDLVMVTITGDRRGGPQVDYTVNPAVGFPYATGPAGSDEPVGHALPAWDCIAGKEAALAVLAAERHRRRTGAGQEVEIALKDVAAAMLGHLGIVGEVAVNGEDRPKLGNALFGAYAQDFTTADGERVMVVALTRRQWDNLTAATGTGEAFAQLAKRIGANLSDEGERFRHREAITAVLKPFFEENRLADFAADFERRGVTWSVYRTFREAVERDPDFAPDGPLYAMVTHPAGRYPTPGSAAAFGAFARHDPRPAPRLGEHTDEILSEIGYAEAEIGRMHDAGVVAGPDAAGAR